MIIEDRLTFDDEPSPQPAPVAPVVVPVTPVQPVTPPRPKVMPSWWQIVPWVVMTVVVASVIGWEAYKGRPSPTPKPQPVAIDPQVRECSANYFGGYPRWYGDVSPLIAAASPDYNEVTNGILKKRETLGTKLGLRLDELTKPLYDPATLAFKDRAESQRVYQNIEASMIAGLKDAAASFK